MCTGHGQYDAITKTVATKFLNRRKGVRVKFGNRILTTILSRREHEDGCCSEKVEKI